MSLSTKQTILHIEDDVVLRNMYKDRLTQAGYKVNGYDDGLQALEYLANHSADLAIVDIMLPKMNGLKIIKTIRQNTKHNNMKIIILTNLTQSNINLHDTVRESLGVSDYFVKSQTSPRQLLSALKAIV